MNQSSNVLGHGEFGSIRTTRRKNIVVKTFNKQKNRNNALKKTILGIKHPDNISSYAVPLHTKQLVMKRLGISVSDLPDFVPNTFSFPFTTMKPFLQAILKLCKQIANFSDHYILHRDIHPGNIMIGVVQQNSITAPSYPIQDLDLFLIDPDLLLVVPDLFSPDIKYNKYTMPPEWKHILLCDACKAAILETTFTLPQIMSMNEYIEHSYKKLGITEQDPIMANIVQDGGKYSNNHGYIASDNIHSGFVASNNILQNKYVALKKIHETLQNSSNRNEIVYRLYSTYDGYGLGISLLELFAKLFKNVPLEEWNKRPDEKKQVESCIGIFQAMSHPIVFQRSLPNDVVTWIEKLSMTIGGIRRSKVSTRRKHK